ncbi:RNA 2',3'-cyclic phosphodiesterase [Bacillus piscicola]|uniref:RNA 2',3'-cyclic phosphodiesterase n=1 Tax=Bacillus piscicola TaxID=1632684 RepID=UPI001F09D00F|nr:RNA 2',3'-cyclic phosphodiesterase [Bacillus piscicola]
MTAPHYFFALPIPNEIKNYLYEWTQHIKEKAAFKRWVHREDYHITLFFLGNVEKIMLENSLQEMNNLIEPLSSFSLSLTVPGSFGQSPSPRIFYAGTERPEQLVKLQRKTADCMEMFGFPSEKRKYRPHITIARKWIGEEPYPGADAFLPLEQRQWQAKEVYLYKTHLDKSPKYEAIHKIKLQK